MDLTRRIARWRNVYGWRLRHWWLDTRAGLQAKVMLAVLGLIVTVGMSVRLFFVARAPVDATYPQQSIIVVVVLLIIALLAAVISLATMSKPKPPTPTAATTPTTEDGQSVVDRLGTFWTDDSFILAWKQMPTEPIQSDGGKK